MTSFRVQIHETRLHQIEVEAPSVEAAAVLAEAVFRVMSHRPAGEFGGATTAVVTNLATGEQWSAAAPPNGSVAPGADETG